MENGKVMVMVMALGPGRLGKQRYLTWQWTGANFLWHYLLFHRKCACTPQVLCPVDRSLHLVVPFEL